MANEDRAFGFKPSGMVRRTGFYEQDASDTTAVFIGDVIDAEDDGNVSPAAAGSTDILGASADYSAASTAKTNLCVFDHPDQEFYAQDDGSATPTTDYRFGNCDHIAGAGDTNTKLSGHEIAADDIKDATAGFRLLGLSKQVGNAIGVNAIWRCTINEHHLAKADGIYAA